MSPEVETQIKKVISRAKEFELEAARILSTHESSRARTITIEQTYSELGGLSLKQDELLRQSLRSIEYSLFRAAHVLSWSAMMDFLEEKLAEDNFQKLQGQYPKWRVGSVEQLREMAPDYQVIEAVRKVGLCSRTEEKALKGLLNKRNECAHPTEYYPRMNESLGYISEILQRIKQFQQRHL